MKYVNSTERLWVRGVEPGGTIVGDPKDPQIVRLLARGQIKPQPKQKEGEK